MKSNLLKNTPVYVDYQDPAFKTAVEEIVESKQQHLATCDLSNVSTEAVAEKAAQKISQTYFVRFNLNQDYSSLQVPYRGVDVPFVVPYDSVIEKIAMHNLKAGLGGATEMDLKVKKEDGFVSVLSVTPKIQATVGNDAFVLTGQGKRGLIAPVVESNLLLREGDVLRVDLLAKQSGLPANCGLTVYLRRV